MAFTAITCTPSDLLAKFKCLKCLSQTELLAIIVLSLSQASRTYKDDSAAIFSASKCYMCLSDSQMLQAITAIVANMGFGDDADIDTIRANIKCMLCASPKQLKAAALFLLCNSFQTDISLSDEQ